MSVFYATPCAGLKRSFAGCGALKTNATDHAMAKQADTKVHVRPLGDKVLIRPLSDEELGTTSPSGIIIPETVDREKTDRGEVVAVGPGRFDEDGKNRVPIDVSVGDKVIFQWGDKIEYQGTEYYLVSESNISAVLV